ncbi:MAG: hypothetical protein ABWX84_08350 [Nocardioides sp.]
MFWWILIGIAVVLALMAFLGRRRGTSGKDSTRNMGDNLREARRSNGARGDMF